jgi:hypothetical protein
LAARHTALGAMTPHLAPDRGEECDRVAGSHRRGGIGLLRELGFCRRLGHVQIALCIIVHAL